MFIERQQHPTIEYDPTAGQQEPTIAHYFSNKAEPLKSSLPLLAHSEGERVLVVSSPLSGLLDEAIRLHRDEAYPAMVVVDEAHRPFFDAVRASIERALAKLDAIQFARMDDEDEDEEG